MSYLKNMSNVGNFIEVYLVYISIKKLLSIKVFKLPCQILRLNKIVLCFKINIKKLGFKIMWISIERLMVVDAI